MVLSAVGKKEEPSGMEKKIVGSIGAAGMALALAMPAEASELYYHSPVHQNPIQTEQPFQPSIHPVEQVVSEELGREESISEESTAALTAAEREAAADRAGLERLRARLLSPKPTAATTTPPARGTYLYGQQPIADQPETAYFVFESQGDQVTGALYMPSSSFDCVQGRIIDRRMALNVTDSYTQETYSYALTLNAPLVEVASQTNNVTPPPNIEGFYPLQVRSQDRAILATCQAI